MWILFLLLKLMKKKNIYKYILIMAIIFLSVPHRYLFMFGDFKIKSVCNKKKKQQQWQQMNKREKWAQIKKKIKGKTHFCKLNHLTNAQLYIVVSKMAALIALNNFFLHSFSLLFWQSNFFELMIFFSFSDKWTIV